MLMKTVVASLASLAAVLAPAVAAACPGSHAAADCAGCGGGSSLTGYILAVGAGLLVGVGSVALERKLRK
jgi:hypothetical protein